MDDAAKTFDCMECPAICCTVYSDVGIDDADVLRLARHLGVSVPAFTARYARRLPGGKTDLRQKPDEISGTGSCCIFLDTETRRCTVYEARPEACRDWPKREHGPEGRCAYFDLLTYVRRESGDESRVPLVQIVRLVA